MKKNIFLKILLSVLLVFLIGAIFSVYSYFFWRKNFYENENILCTEDIVKQEFFIDDKIKQFILSNDKSEFMELTKEEALYLLSQNIQTAGGLEVQNICIKTEKSTWRIYFNTRLDVLNIPWVSFDLVKDNRETAELYVKDLYVADYLIPKNLVKKIISDINTGISDATILVNENAFLGRTIKNIELLEDRVVVKGNI